MSSGPDLRTRRALTVDDLQTVYDGLLRPSFPPAELVTMDWLVDGVADGSVSVHLVEAHGAPVSVSVTERLGTTGCTMLSYLATSPEMRGRGVGSRLFARMMQSVRVEDRPRLVVAEVERPDRHTGSAEHGDPAARLRFYGRQGATALDLPYFQPGIGEGAPVLGMLLLALHVDSTLVMEGPDGPAVPGWTLVDDVVDVILGERSESESPESSALRVASGRQLVRLVPVEDYATISPSRGSV